MIFDISLFSHNTKTRAGDIHQHHVRIFFLLRIMHRGIIHLNLHIPTVHALQILPDQVRLVFRYITGHDVACFPCKFRRQDRLATRSRTQIHDRITWAYTCRFHCKCGAGILHGKFAFRKARKFTYIFQILCQIHIRKFPALLQTYTGFLNFLRQ